MSDVLLERRCRRLARVYRDRTRADEALTTLMESNEGRRAPRPGDVVNVLWHGIVSRLGDSAPGGRFAQWGDAVAGAFVQITVMYAAVAVALTRYYPQRSLDEWQPTRGWYEPQYAPVFLSRYEQRVALALAVLAAVTALALCLGRVRAARVSSVLTVLVGLVAVVFSAGHDLTLRTSVLIPVIVVSVVVMLGTLGTSAAARAARSVPAWWWGMSAVASCAVALWALQLGWNPFDVNRRGLVLVAYAVQPVMLLLLAAPLARSFPGAFGAVAGAALVAMPLTVLVSNRWLTTPLGGTGLVAVGFAGAVIVALVGVLVLRSRTSAT